MKTKKTLNFKVLSLSGQADLQCTVDQLIMAGWVGRNREALQAHIDELAELGIPDRECPGILPSFRGSSFPGCIDPGFRKGYQRGGRVFLVRQGAETYVGLGSDQTDRALETNSITLSKQICDKVLCSTLWPFQEVQTHWDRLRLRAWIEEEGKEVLYQEGLLGEMLAPGELFEKRFDGELPEGTVLFGGTMSVIGGVRPSEKFQMELHDPELQRSLEHGYQIEILNVPG